MTQHQANPSPGVPPDLPPPLELPKLDDLQSIIKGHSVPQDAKLEKRLRSLQRMYDFYETKTEGAPTRQTMMFVDFMTSLYYAMTLIKMYRQLTKRLAELAAEGATDETRINSQS